MSEQHSFEHNDTLDFMDWWEKSYTRYATISAPVVFPPELVGDRLGKYDIRGDPGIPVIGGEFAERVRGAVGIKARDAIRIAHARGTPYVYPMERVGDESRLLVDVHPPDEFQQRFGYTPNAEQARSMKLYYQVDAMVAGGVDLMFAARFLQARDIQAANPSVEGETVQESFGLHQTVDESKEVLNHLKALINSESVDELREMMLTDPAWFSVYIVDTISDFIQNRDRDPDTVDMDWYKKVVKCVSEATIGMPVEAEGQTLLIPGINSANAYLRDSIMACEQPYLFAIANRGIEQRFNIAHENRFNQLYLSMMFGQALTNAELVTDEDLVSGATYIQSLVKPVASVSTRIFQENPQLSEQVMNLARQAHLLEEGEESDLPEDTGSVLNTLCQCAYEGTLEGASRRDLSDVIGQFEQGVRDRYDVVRCRAYFHRPADLNQAIERAHSMAVVHKDEGARVFGLHFLYGPKSCVVRELSDEELPQDPAADTIEQVLSLPPGHLLFTKFFYTGPINIGQRESGKKPNVSVVEIQMGLAQLEKVNIALEPAYRAQPRSLEAAGISPEMVAQLQERSRQALKKFKGSSSAVG